MTGYDLTYTPPLGVVARGFVDSCFATIVPFNQGSRIGQHEFYRCSSALSWFFGGNFFVAILVAKVVSMARFSKIIGTQRYRDKCACVARVG